MKKINSKIRVSELADASLRMIDLYKKESALSKDAILKPLFAEIETQNTALSVAMKKEIAVSNLEKADELRDESIRNLYDILKGYKAMRSVEVKTAAEALLLIFDKYGVAITRESYASESALIESMLRDFSVAEAVENIEKLTEVKETLAEIRDRQTAFHNERLAYEKSLSDKGSTASATALKKPFLDLINVRLVSFLTSVEQVDLYKNFASVIAQVIKDANEAVERRVKK